MRVVAVAGDAGGARALMPVLERIGRSDQVECCAYGPALGIMERAGLGPTPVTRVSLSPGTNRLLLGTTVGSVQWEPLFIREARDRRIRSVTVLDGWGKYRERFMDSEGRLVMPDAIAVEDDDRRRELVGLGFPKAIVVVTGQPALDALADPAARRVDASGVRARLAIPADRALVAYVEQPLSEVHDPGELGFDENECRRDVLAALAEVAARRRVAATVAVLEHPRSTSAGRTPLERAAGLDVRTVHDIDRHDLLRASDLVIGMNSALLVEACLLGRAVVSYQPGIRIADPLLANRRGWSRAVYRSSDLVSALDAELFDPATRAERRRVLASATVDGHATDRVLELLMADYLHKA
jgi:hypothetical protein